MDIGRRSDSYRLIATGKVLLRTAGTFGHQTAGWSMLQPNVGSEAPIPLLSFIPRTVVRPGADLIRLTERRLLTADSVGVAQVGY